MSDLIQSDGSVKASVTKKEKAPFLAAPVPPSADEVAATSAPISVPEPPSPEKSRVGKRRGRPPGKKQALPNEALRTMTLHITQDLYMVLNDEAHRLTKESGTRVSISEVARIAFENLAKRRAA